MANKVHVALVKKGTESINNWKLKNFKKTLNLSGASLEGINLSYALLQGTNFSDAQLRSTDLTGANLTGANFERADLSAANLHESRCYDVDFTDANLAYTDLLSADLMFASFDATYLEESNLAGTFLTNAEFIDVQGPNIKLASATLDRTIFVNCNFMDFQDLGSVIFRGPVHIDFETITQTFRKAGNYLTQEVESFLRKSGMPSELIRELPRILSEVKYRSSFVCYGQPDLEIAEKLVDDLRVKGASCWLYSLDSTPGRRTWEEIGESRRRAEKMIVLCSSKSLIRDGVLKEIEEQIDEDLNKIVPISLDNLWKEEGFIVKRGQRDLKPFLLDRNYADFGEELDYDDSLSKLLKGLQRKLAISNE